MGKRKLNVGLYIVVAVIICVASLLIRLFVLKDADGGSTPMTIGTVFLLFGAYYLCSKPVDEDEE